MVVSMSVVLLCLDAIDKEIRKKRRLKTLKKPYWDASKL
jgi:hypothetical protein